MVSYTFRPLYPLDSGQHLSRSGRFGSRKSIVLLQKKTIYGSLVVQVVQHVIKCNYAYFGKNTGSKYGVKYYT
jgi:hypothetical protein